MSDRDELHEILYDVCAGNKFPEDAAEQIEAMGSWKACIAPRLHTDCQTISRQQRINQSANNLVECLISGTVYEDGNPSIYVGSIDELFSSVDTLRDALSESSGEGDIDCHDCGEDTCVCVPDTQ